VEIACVVENEHCVQQSGR